MIATVRSCPAIDSAARLVQEFRNSSYSLLTLTNCPSLHGILQEAPNSTYTIFPADLLPFLAGSATIADSHLVNSEAALGDFNGDFRFEAEPVFRQRKALDDFAPKQLAAGFHVAQVEVHQHVQQSRVETNFRPGAKSRARDVDLRRQSATRKQHPLAPREAAREAVDIRWDRTRGHRPG